MLPRSSSVLVAHLVAEAVSSAFWAIGNDPILIDHYSFSYGVVIGQGPFALVSKLADTVTERIRVAWITWQLMFSFCVCGARGATHPVNFVLEWGGGPAVEPGVVPWESGAGHDEHEPNFS